MGFFGPQGPLMVDTQGLLTSTTLLEHVDKNIIKIMAIKMFFIAVVLKNYKV
jgi:hypothetical protein